MDSVQYFKHALKNKLCDNIRWYFITMTQIQPNTENEYVSSDANSVYVKINGENILVEDKKVGDILVDYRTTLELSSDDLVNIDGTISTTIGRAVVNYLLLANPFGDKIKYINKQFSSGNVEGLISDYLFKETISVSEYIKFVNNCSFIQPLTKIFIVAATVKNTTKPEGIDKFKEELTIKFNEEYGKEWVNDPVLAGNFSAELQKFDSEYLKDDPSLGKLLTKKITSNARTKMYLAIGSEKSFDGRTPMIENSLIDGFPKDNECLSYIFNGGRLGSFDRGHETQKGGAVAKDLLRTAGGIKIVEGDCGSKVLKETLITPDNAQSVLGTYVHNGDGKLFPLMDPENYIGKKLFIRTPLFCNLEGKKFCSVCVGKTLSSRKDGINLLFTTVSTPILTASLKGMHNSQIATVNVSLVDNVK